MNQNETDKQVVKQWLDQDSPTPDELTEDDVFFAYLASEVLTNYQNDSKWNQFRFDYCTGLSYHAMEVGWEQAISDIKRGVAILNGYILWRNEKTATYNNPKSHKDSVMDRLFGAGYVALTEQHVIYSLIPANDLITISQAAVLVYGENTQSKRVMIKDDIQSGHLQVFYAKDEKNPQKNQRVSHRQSVKLKLQRNV